MPKRAFEFATTSHTASAAPYYLSILFLLMYLEKDKDDVFKKLRGLLMPLGIKRFFTDNWGAYERHLPSGQHIVLIKKPSNARYCYWLVHKQIRIRTRLYEKEQMHKFKTPPKILIANEEKIKNCFLLLARLGGRLGRLYS